MLTAAQKQLHWKAWAACAHSNSWSMEKARLHPDAQRTRGETIYHKLVWREAERLARQESRGVAADDLRHACYLVATSQVPGWPASARPVDSMADLGNRTFSRVLVLWKLLIDAEDLAALIKWENPADAERETLIKSIERRAPDAVIRAISANAWGTRAWETIDDLGRLRWLLKTLAEKQTRHQQPVSQPF